MIVVWLWFIFINPVVEEDVQYGGLQCLDCCVTGLSLSSSGGGRCSVWGAPMFRLLCDSGLSLSSSGGGRCSVWGAPMFRLLCDWFICIIQWWRKMFSMGGSNVYILLSFNSIWEYDEYWFILSILTLEQILLLLPMLQFY